MRAVFHRPQTVGGGFAKGTGDQPISVHRDNVGPSLLFCITAMSRLVGNTRSRFTEEVSGTLSSVKVRW